MRPMVAARVAASIILSSLRTHTAALLQSITRIIIWLRNSAAAVGTTSPAQHIVGRAPILPLLHCQLQCYIPLLQAPQPEALKTCSRRRILPQDALRRLWAVTSQ